jgi:hypothetical protein
MELVTNKVNIKIDGVAYGLSHPKVKDIRVLSKSKEELDIDSVINLVISCGLPEEIVDNLTADHLNKIVEVLMGKNQKK